MLLGYELAAKQKYDLYAVPTVASSLVLISTNVC